MSDVRHIQATPRHTKDGKWQRSSVQQCRNFISSASNDNANTKHPPEAGRFHLYVSLACGWSSRVALMRSLKGLKDVIDMTIVNPRRLDDVGWSFLSSEDAPCDEDSFAANRDTDAFAASNDGKQHTDILSDPELLKLFPECAGGDPLYNYRYVYQL